MGKPWPFTQQNVSRWVVWCVLILFFCFTTLVVVAAENTRSGVVAAQAGGWENAQDSFQRAASLVEFFSWVTFHKSRDIEFWRFGLIVARNVSQYQLRISDAGPAEPVLLSDEVAQIVHTARPMAELWPRTVAARWLINSQLNQSEKAALSTSLGWLQDHSQIFDWLTNSLNFWRHGQRKILVLLQNSDELRPTGGFMGSYAVVEFVDGKLAPIVITDIYAPAGQLAGYVAAPPGVKEYLSSGQGWGLPDANWSPDFPTSARDIQLFMTKAKQPEFDAVVALNLRVFERVLECTGPLLLPDQKITLTAQNVGQLARADRTSFFAGSYQKPQLLQNFATQLKLTLSELSMSQKIALFRILIEQAQQKNIQVFAKDRDTQQLSQIFGISGELPQTHPVNELLFAAVEANVGINKVNRFVERTFAFQQQQPHSVDAILTFTNTSSDQDYVQYLRLVSLSSVSVSEISINGVPAPRIDTTPLTTSSGKVYSQTGFLVAVPRGQTSTVQATLTDASSVLFQTLWVWKQAGIPPTPVQIISGKTTRNTLLQTDVSLSLGNSP
jgi:hypothetical protein